MTLPTFAQASFAGTILASTVGTYIALSPPNPNPESTVSPVDLIHSLQLTSKHITKLAVFPVGLLALHTACLAYFHPNIPPSVLRHGAQNPLNTRLIKWSSPTAIPLALILCAGIPLRLVSYTLLGKNFTFALAEPDHLTTTGIYRYVQHPSYTGLMILIICNVVLLGRPAGAVGCWIPPSYYRTVQASHRLLAPLGLSILLFAIWTRVRQEERMLRAEFGAQWERWHAATSRFIPWLF